MNIFRSPAQIAITILCCRDSSPPFRVSHHGLCQCQGLIITPQSTLHIGGSSLPDMGDPSPLCLTTLIIQHNTNTPLPLEVSKRISWLTIRDLNVNYTSFLWGAGELMSAHLMWPQYVLWGAGTKSGALIMSGPLCEGLRLVLSGDRSVFDGVTFHF